MVLGLRTTDATGTWKRPCAAARLSQPARERTSRRDRRHLWRTATSPRWIIACHLERYISDPALFKLRLA